MANFTGRNASGSIVTLGSETVSNVEYPQYQMASPGGSQISQYNPLPVISATVQPNGTQADQRLTVDGTAGGLQFSAFHADTRYVFLTVEGGPCRFTLDDSAPTSSNGHLLNIGDTGFWPKEMAQVAKFIRSGAVDSVIQASQMK